MWTEPSLKNLLDETESALNEPVEAECAKRIVRLVIATADDENRKNVKKLLLAHLMTKPALRVRKAILVVLKVFGVESEDFQSIQTCLDFDDNSTFMAWNLLADNAHRADINYLRNNRTVWQRGIDDTDLSIRACAMKLLNHCKDASDTKKIAALLTAQDAATRGNAIKQLAASGNAILECSDEISAYIRFLASAPSLDWRFNSEIFDITQAINQSDIILSGADLLVSLIKKGKFESDSSGSSTGSLCELLGLCGDSAVPHFSLLKQAAMEYCNYQYIRACIWMARRCESVLDETLEVCDYVIRNATDQSRSAQVVRDIALLNERAASFIPRLCEILEDTQNEEARFCAALSLASLGKKSQGENIRSILLRQLDDKNSTVVDGACRAFAILFENDPNVDPVVLTAIEKLAEGSNYRVKNSARETYMKLTGKVLSEKSSSKLSLKEKFDLLKNEDPFVPLESLQFLLGHPDLKDEPIESFSEYIPVLVELALNPPARFSVLDETFHSLSSLQQCALAMLTRFGVLAREQVPQFIHYLDNTGGDRTQNQVYSLAAETVARISPDSPELLVYFQKKIRQDIEQISTWVSALAKMGSMAVPVLIETLQRTTRDYSSLPRETNEFYSEPSKQGSLLASRQQYICSCLGQLGGAARAAIPDLVEIMLDELHESKTAHWCGGGSSNNRISAVEALCKIEPEDSRLADALLRLGSEHYLVRLYNQTKAETQKQLELKRALADKDNRDSFFKAIQENDLIRMSALLESGVKPSQYKLERDYGDGVYEGESTVAVAMRGRKMDALRLLIHHGADLNMLDKRDFRTPLCHAIERTQIEAALLLLDAGAESRLPLVSAFQQDNVVMLVALLCAGLNPDEEDRGTTAMSIAVMNGNLRAVIELLDFGAKPDSKYAAQALDRGHEKIAQILIAAAESSAEQSQEENSEEIFWSAIQKGLYQTALDCLQKGKLKKLRNDWAIVCLDRVIKDKQRLLLELLVDHVVSPNLRGRDAVTPLMLAAKTGDLELCRILVSRKAGLHLRSANRENAVLSAAQGGNVDLLKYLLEQGAILDSVDDRARALVSAGSNGYRTMIDYLLSLGADINSADVLGNTALHNAANAEIIQHLIASGANLEARNTVGETPLISHVSRAKLDCVEALLAAGANVNASQKYGDTALSRARGHNQLALVKVLEAHSAAEKQSVDTFIPQINAVFMTVPGRDPKGDADRPGKRSAGISETIIEISAPGHGTSGLIEEMFDAINKRDTARVKEILEQGCDANVTDHDRRTPVMCAAAGHSEEIVELLLSAGADPNAQRKDGTTPLQWAIQNCKWAGGKTKTLELLLAAGADPDMRGCSETPLSEATRANCLAAVQVLLKAGARFDAPAHYWEPLICVAARNGSTELVSFYLQAGADPNSFGRGSFSGIPLIQLALRNPDIVKLLLAHGADPDLPGNLMETALIAAAGSGYVDVLQLLLEHDPSRDVNQRNCIGQTALMRATQQGHEAAVKFLLGRGADASLKDNDGKTALMMARDARYKGASCINLLEKAS